MLWSGEFVITDAALTFITTGCHQWWFDYTQTFYFWKEKVISSKIACYSFWKPDHRYSLGISYIHVHRAFCVLFASSVLAWAVLYMECMDDLFDWGASWWQFIPISPTQAWPGDNLCEGNLTSGRIKALCSPPLYSTHFLEYVAKNAHVGKLLACYGSAN